VKQLATLFLRLGITAFGGPAAHIAMMRDEVVDRRHWMTDSEFLDLLAVTNLIPGPNSTEMAIHIGYKRCGLPGLLTAGACFIVPACLLVIMIAWGYTRYGETPQVAWLTYGVGPVIIAIILQAVGKLTRSVSGGVTSTVIGLAATVLAIGGVNELALLAGGGIVALVARRVARFTVAGIFIMLTVSAATVCGTTLAAETAIPVTLTRLTLFFLKVGSILFGSGYVLLAFLRADLTERWSWLTEQQLIDAVTVGQVTPGPVFTTATFIGFLLGGWSGAVLATLAIFAPGFIFVAVTHPLIGRLRASALASDLVDGVAAASLGLMVAVTWHLGRAAIVDLPTAALLVASGTTLTVWRPNSTWLIVSGAILGWALRGGQG
jgi:chromate transporter